MQHDRITYALHRSRRDDPLSLDRHGLCPAAPEGIDDGLDVLLVHHQEVRFDTVRCHARRGIIQGDRNRRTRDRRQADATGLPAKFGRAVRSVVAASSEPVDFLAQRRQLMSQVSVVTRLRLYEADQIGIPGWSQIGTLCVHRADDDHQSGERTHRGGERTSKRSAISIPAPMGVASSSQNRDKRAPRVMLSCSRIALGIRRRRRRSQRKEHLPSLLLRAAARDFRRSQRIGGRMFGQVWVLLGSSRNSSRERLTSLAGRLFDYATYFNSKENLVPESRTRKSAEEKQKLKAKQASKPKKVKAPASRRWVPPAFIAVGLLGVAWLITYYVAGTYIPFMDALGNWNILIGMGGMAAAFVIATLWR